MGLGCKAHPLSWKTTIWQFPGWCTPDASNLGSSSSLNLLEWGHWDYLFTHLPHICVTHWTTLYIWPPSLAPGPQNCHVSCLLIYPSAHDTWKSFSTQEDPTKPQFSPGSSPALFWRLPHQALVLVPTSVTTCRPKAPGQGPLLYGTLCLLASSSLCPFKTHTYLTNLTESHVAFCHKRPRFRHESLASAQEGKRAPVWLCSHCISISAFPLRQFHSHCPVKTWATCWPPQTCPLMTFVTAPFVPLSHNCILKPPCPLEWHVQPPTCLLYLRVTGTSSEIHQGQNPIPNILSENDCYHWLPWIS